MNKDLIIEKLEIFQEKLLYILPEKFRPFFDTINKDTKNLMLVGSRGTGKTTFLLKNLKEKNALYISADNPIVSTIPLFDLVEAAFLKGYESVFIDEVHFANDWSIHLKGIYDVFPDKNIWVSDSSSIILQKGVSDLSRRFPIIEIPLLSLREFIYLVDGKLYPIIDPFDYDPKIIKKIISEINVLSLYRDYIDHGFRPIFLEDLHMYDNKLLKIVEKSIQSDILFLLPQLRENYLRIINAIIGYLALAKIPRLIINSLCKEFSIGKEKLYQLLNALEAIKVIRIIRHEKDYKLNSVGSKIFLYDPGIYKIFNGDSGNLREAYVAALFSEAGMKVYSSKKEEYGDFVIDEKLIEVGGKNKKIKKADFVLKDDIEIPVKNSIPLWLIGFLY
ncbi:putative ATPase (AAA+ superfamily) [Marinitoga piezophila KA3]|uniref:Putative ATPase (AAA+ superfamily) n=1 Tax=Marinitoga piezophila (strain DSM 14283 / JCM 11233 / KA3) TaxID=443254 RepID=H2J4U4_MARPK|nr:AAA family ATPase [Marinitoga piezophila]AEX84879.1 putative ATPase (AAA+ superfamily) [Marinitoga piezophila KA3]